uniref:Uncharacterized protein n=1 Tax=Dunaliella tertiolecta TaxID=3047 RepID=A0A7S3R611_DUNTE
MELIKGTFFVELLFNIFACTSLPLHPVHLVDGTQSHALGGWNSLFDVALSSCPQTHMCMWRCEVGEGLQELSLWSSLEHQRIRSHLHGVQKGIHKGNHEGVLKGIRSSLCGAHTDIMA